MFHMKMNPSILIVKQLKMLMEPRISPTIIMTQAVMMIIMIIHILQELADFTILTEDLAITLPAMWVFIMIPGIILIGTGHRYILVTVGVGVVLAGGIPIITGPRTITTGMVIIMDIGMAIMHLIIMTMETTRIIMVIALPEEAVRTVLPTELVPIVILHRA